jgi:integrase
MLQEQVQNQVLDRTLNEYIENTKIRNKKTAAEYRKRLNHFKVFVLKNYNLTLDQLIMTLTSYSHGPKIDVYNLLSEYVKYIQKERNVKPQTLKLLVYAVRAFLETFDVEISPRKFRFKVIMPRVIRSKKEALQKSDIQTILNACHNIKLKSYVLFLAATGCRASEALSVRPCDIDFNNDPATVFIRGEHTKTGEDRIIPLTPELAQQLKLWMDYKYRTRMITHHDKRNGNTYVEKRTPKMNKEILLFSNKYEKDPTIEGLYNDMLMMFEGTLDRLGGKYAEFEHSKKRRKFTLHSFRRWVKTTISEPEKIKLFKKIEPYLTFLDQSGLERKGAELENRLEVMERENTELRVQQRKKESEVQSLKEKYELDMKSIRQDMNNQFSQVMELVRENPKLAKVKPEVLAKKKN